MDGEVWVMVIFAIGILVALAVSLLTLVLRQVKDGDITWLSSPGAGRPSGEWPPSSEAADQVRASREPRPEPADEVRTNGARGRSR